MTLLPWPLLAAETTIVCHHDMMILPYFNHWSFCCHCILLACTQEPELHYIYWHAVKTVYWMGLCRCAEQQSTRQMHMHTVYSTTQQQDLKNIHTNNCTRTHTYAGNSGHETQFYNCNRSTTTLCNFGSHTATYAGQHASPGNGPQSSAFYDSKNLVQIFVRKKRAVHAITFLQQF